MNNIDFTKFQKILLNSSILFEVLAVNIIWCNRPNIISNTQLELKENYRQLKMVAAKNEDSVTKFDFQELEMDENLEILKKEKKYLDVFILWTNKHSNSYGNNWLKSLVYIILINIIFFTIIRYIQGYTIFDKKIILEEIGSYFLFINPVHRFIDVFAEEPLAYKNTLFWDSISRIFNAYLIFQFISAFRKFNK